MKMRATRTHSIVSREVASASGGLLYGWLLVVIFFEYSRPGSFMPILQVVPLNSMLPLGLVVACFIAPGLRPVRQIFSDSIAWWILCYLALISMGWLHAEVTLRAFNTFKTCTGYALLAFMIARICTTKSKVLGVFAGLIVSHMFLLTMNPSVILDPSNRNYVRGATFLGDGNDFSLSICILIPFALALARTRQSKLARIVWLISATVLVLAVVGTASRGGALALLAVTGFFILNSARRMPAILAALIVGFVVVAYAPTSYFTRVKTVATYEEDTSATGRIEAWKAGMRMGLKNPILGVGPGNFPNSFPKYRGEDAPVRWMTAHSMYFLVLGELGVTGLRSAYRSGVWKRFQKHAFETSDNFQNGWRGK